MYSVGLFCVNVVHLRQFLSNYSSDPSLTLSTQSLGRVDRVVSVARDADTGASNAEPPTTESEMGEYFKRQ